MNCGDCTDCPFELLEGMDKRGLSDHFEIHMTVETDDVYRFRVACENEGIKVIVITYDNGTAIPGVQPMTAQRVVGTLADVRDEIDRIRAVFAAYRFKEVRLKIETGPSGALDYDKVYMEGHLAIKIKPAQYAELHGLCEQIGVHMSRNAIKVHAVDDPSRSTYMVTHRDYISGARDFIYAMRQIRNGLGDQGYKAHKTIVECCIVDSNEGVDDEWLRRAPLVRPSGETVRDTKGEVRLIQKPESVGEKRWLRKLSRLTLPTP